MFSVLCQAALRPQDPFGEACPVGGGQGQQPLLGPYKRQAWGLGTHPAASETQEGTGHLRVAGG